MVVLQLGGGGGRPGFSLKKRIKKREALLSRCRSTLLLDGLTADGLGQYRDSQIWHDCCKATKEKQQTVIRSADRLIRPFRSENVVMS